MNLTSIPSLTATLPAQPGLPAGKTPAESALLPEFTALLGMAANPVMPGAISASPAKGGKNLPETDGNPLPPVDAEGGELPVGLAMLLLTVPPAPVVPPAAVNGAEASHNPTSLVAPQSPAKPQTKASEAPPVPAAPAPAGLQVQFDLRLNPSQSPVQPPQTVAQVQAQAEVAANAQTMPSAQQLAARPLAAQPQSRREQASATPVPGLSDPSEAVASPPEAVRGAALLPVSSATPLLADLPRPMVVESAAPLAPTAAPTDRHDFSAVVDRLAEAREMAHPGRAAMQLAHREFGPVSVQFDISGQSLKVALSSPDAGFAPAVQAALTDRPIAAVADTARSDTQGQRSDQSAPPPTSPTGVAAQGDMQRGEQQARHAAARGVSDQVLGQPQGASVDDDAASPARRAGDGSLFA